MLQRYYELRDVTKASISNIYGHNKIGISVRTTWATKTGGILLEVDSMEGANTLTEKVRQTVVDKTRITRLDRQIPVLLLDVPN